MTSFRTIFCHLVFVADFVVFCNFCCHVFRFFCLAQFFSFNSFQKHFSNMLQILNRRVLPTFGKRTFSAAAAAIKPTKKAQQPNYTSEQDDGRPIQIPKNVWQKIGTNLHQRVDHPIGIIKCLVEEVFRKETGNFEIYDDFNPSVSVKNCFDDLLTPKDHISRSTSDTFYVDNSNVLRTHATAHQSTLLREGKNAVLWTCDVYRKDEIDRFHYPVFHQTDGIRVWSNEELEKMAENLNLKTKEEVVVKDLQQILEKVVRKLFGNEREIKWSPDYFPFTDPSFELEVDYNGKWVEVLGCGKIRQEILKEANLTNHQGWAFGLGLERLAMILFNIPDIRLFWSNDERFTKQFSEGKINEFKPFSNMPPVFKDLAFWIGKLFKFFHLTTKFKN